jgi:hypothetical protein
MAHPLMLFERPVQKIKHFKCLKNISERMNQMNRFKKWAENSTIRISRILGLGS